MSGFKQLYQCREDGLSVTDRQGQFKQELPNLYKLSNKPSDKPRPR